MQQLDKQRALELIPLVVDDEADPKERRSFFEFIEHHDEIKRQFESQKKIKELVKTRYKRINAPNHLKQNIHRLVNQEEQNQLSGDALDMESSVQMTDEQSLEPSEGNRAISRIHPAVFYRVAMAAVAVILLSILTIDMLDRISPASGSVMSVEEFAFSHFTESGGNLSFAGWQPGSLTDAYQHLVDEYDVEIRLPVINRAELTNVFYTEFVPDYKTPILEYYQEDSNEYIYVFAFKIDNLSKFSKLVRDPEAVEKCKTFEDFHVKEIEGKHVVSWKWGDNWYAAVSNHNGYDLAAIIQPMDGSWTNNGW